MIKCFKEAFELAYENLLCVSPLLIFMIAVTLYLGAARTSIINAFSLCLSIVALIIMFAIFFAGWFYMIKMAIVNTSFSIIDLKKDFELLKFFSTGVSDYFVTFIYFILCSLTILGIVYASDYFIAMKFIGNVGLELNNIVKLEDISSWQYLLVDLTYSQIIKLSGWLFLFTVSSIIYALFTLMWVPYLMFRTKNVFKALWYSIVDAFTSPKILTLLLSLIIINFVFAIINSYIMLNPILYFIMTIAYIFFIVQMSMLIFLYYYKKYTYEHED